MDLAPRDFPPDAQQTIPDEGECLEYTIKNMLDLGFKERKLIEYLLLVLKKQDNVKEILNLIH